MKKKNRSSAAQAPAGPRTVSLGDTVTRRVESLGAPKLWTGRVVYIHPQGRFHVVSFPVGFDGSGGAVRESFPVVTG